MRGFAERAYARSLRLDKATGCFGAEGAGRLAAALRINSTLRVLEIDGATGPEGRMGREGATAFAQALMTRRRLQRLHLNFSNLGDEGVAAIVEALQADERLQDLGAYVLCLCIRAIIREESRGLCVCMCVHACVRAGGRAGGRPCASMCVRVRPCESVRACACVRVRAWVRACVVVCACHIRGTAGA